MLMGEHYAVFKTLLEAEQKDEAIEYALHLLESKEMDVIGLYTQILTPALNHMACDLQDRAICIWKEHVRTAIVRTIVECCYPYVVEKKRQQNYESKGTAVVMCPPEEYHDLGARMAADFYTICGYHTIFVGSNTPYQDFYNAVDVIKPDLLAISVSNYYNLLATKRIIEELKYKKHVTFPIVAGGLAFDHDLGNCDKVGADRYVQTFEDIAKMAESGVVE